MSDEVKKVERKPAPAIQIGHADPRAEIVNALNAGNPKFVYAWVSGEKKPHELKRDEQEVVKGESGDPYTHNGDIVVRMNREDFEAKARAQGDLSRTQVEAVVNREKSTVFASPKKQRE